MKSKVKLKKKMNVKLKWKAKLKTLYTPPARMNSFRRANPLLRLRSAQALLEGKIHSDFIKQFKRTANLQSNAF